MGGRVAVAVLALAACAERALPIRVAGTDAAMPVDAAPPTDLAIGADLADELAPPDLAVPDDLAIGTLDVEPSTITVPAGRNQIFVASGATGWTVAENGGGSIDASGMYRAPEQQGTYHVIASDGVRTGSATVKVVQMNLSIVTGGLGGFGMHDAVGEHARFAEMEDLVYDGAGGVLIAESDYGLIRRFDVATGAVTTLAGGGSGNGTDGVGTAATFNFPRALAFRAATNTLYIGDYGAAQVRALDLATGQVTTVAGTYGVHGTADGIGLGASFQGITGLCVIGNTLYVADQNANHIRAVDLTTKAVKLLAGKAPGGYLDDPDPLQAMFYRPIQLACSDTTVYVADSGNMAIRTLDQSGGPNQGAVGTLARGTAAGLYSPTGLVLDAVHGALYATQWTSSHVVAIDLGTAQVHTVAGSRLQAGWQDGVGGAARFAQPIGIATDGTTVWVADSGQTYGIRAIDVGSSEVTTVAGKSMYPAAGSQDGSLATAKITDPSAITTDGKGKVYVAENHDIRIVSLGDGTVTRLAGQPGKDGNKDGADGVALLGIPFALTVGPTGVVLAGVSRYVRAIASEGSITTPYSGFNFLYGLTTAGGDLFASDSYFGVNALHEIDMATNARIDVSGFSGAPSGLATDGAGKVWVADSWHAKIEEVDLTTGAVTTIAGAADVYDDTDGIGSGAHFRQPTGMAYDGQGSLYVSDFGSQLIRRIWLPTRAVSTYAGQVGQMGVDPGPLQTATISRARSITWEPTTAALMLIGEQAVLKIAP